MNWYRRQLKTARRSSNIISNTIKEYILKNRRNILMENEKEVKCMDIDTDTRTRTTVNCCWNCRNGSEDVDQELKGYFCNLDGCKVSLFQICKDWENDA